MKKIISIALTIILVFSLCACGSLNIGPITFDFDKLGGHSVSSDTGSADSAWGSGDISAEAPEDDAAPDMEMPDVEGSAAVVEPSTTEPEDSYDTYGDFSFTMWDMYLGYFSPKGFNQDFATEPVTPYLIMVFDYEEHTSYPESSFRTYSEYITVENVGSFAPVNPDNYNYHFVNSIDRYFGISNSYEHQTLNPGESDLMFACYPITDEAAAMVEAGAAVYIKIGESEIEHHGATPIYLPDEILTVYDYYGYDYETAHAGATLLWSLDFSYDVLNGQFAWFESRGDTGNAGSDLDLVPELYFGGSAASPASVPNLDGEFFLNVGAPAFSPELGINMYPELDGIIYEYMELCRWFCDASAEPGNLDEAADAINTIQGFYYEMCAIMGVEPLF